MTSSQAPTEVHPITGFACRLREVLQSHRDTPTWSMTVDDQRTALVELARAEAQLAELRLRVLAQAERSDIAADSAASSTSAWVAEATRQTRGDSYRDLRLSQELDERFALTRDALAGGGCNLEQARVIVSAVKRLPEAATEADREKAEVLLVAAAAEHDAKALKALGRHIFEVIDPDAADAALGKKLSEEEARARRLTFLELADNGDGTHSGRFRIPALHAAMLKRALDALMAPRHAAQTGKTKDEQQPDPQPVGGAARSVRRGEAFCAFLERYPTKRLPKVGGLNATVVVTTRLEALQEWYATAGLDDGTVISAGEARRLACNAGIIPAVLGGESEVLDWGRARRFHTTAQRHALGLRDNGCTARGCGRPAWVCEAHHDVRWSRGGHTSLGDGRLLCPWHHHRIHDPRYDITRHPDNQVTFHRRT